MRHALFVLAAWALVLGGVGLAWACPTCKDALFEPDQVTQRVSSARGYAVSIGLLLTVPFALAGIVATRIVRAHRRGRGPLDPPGQSR